MGNKNCCARHAPSLSKRKTSPRENKYDNHLLNERDTSVNFLPHISEREVPDGFY